MFKKKSKKQEKENPKLLSGFQLMKMAIGGAAQLRSKADEVNRLNVFPVPDGDTGDNMRMTIESGIAALENLDTDDLAEVMKVFSHGMLLGARGNSGVILSQFFAGTAKGFENADNADPETLGYALQLGVKQAYMSVMTPTEGTILTVAREAVEYAVKKITPESTIRTFFADLVKEMHRSLDRTPEILTVLKEAGVVDSGGAGLLHIMEGFNRVLNGEEVEDALSAAPAAKPAAAVTSFGPDSEMTYGYCTELLLQLTRKKTDVEAYDIEPLKQFLVGIGDSVVCFKTESIVKIHVHTLTPDKVLAHCLQYGEFLTVKIENMSVQHTDIEDKRSDESESSEQPEQQPAKKYGIVEVCIGKGIEELFRDFGTDVIVEGGQTQNPSTNDFLDAFAKVNAEHIFVFPNNGNILMAAQQAAELYDKAEVHVIPSKSIGTGYVALSCIDPEAPSAEDILAAVKETMGRVTTGYVSPSIRNADINGVHIKKGDTIGIVDKQIVLAETERAAAAEALAARLLALPEKFMLTVFCGKDATEEERTALNEALAAAHPSAELYFIDGGQDIYPYIFVAE